MATQKIDPNITRVVNSWPRMASLTLQAGQALGREKSADIQSTYSGK